MKLGLSSGDRPIAVWFCSTGSTGKLWISAKVQPRFCRTHTAAIASPTANIFKVDMI
ncbi:hypothetical protein H6G17_10705 [Chroococcidiopsis sp. FACHB-1243]|nr:hypothetical protein [Chroococcidiopsis sp. [FACHB-1243]]